MPADWTIETLLSSVTEALVVAGLVRSLAAWSWR